MMRRAAAACALALVAAAAFARADVGATVHATLARIESTPAFAGATVTHASLGARHEERWKLATGAIEMRIYTLDGTGINGTVRRERYIRMTERDPFSFTPRSRNGNDDLDEVISAAQRADYANAAQVATVVEAPLHLTATFYRGHSTAYEVLEPNGRKRGAPDRFEWRTFPLAELQAAIVAARACDNGEDCAAW